MWGSVGRVSGGFVSHDSYRPAHQASGGTSHGLTEREFEVLRLLADGCSNEEIGAALFISPKTAGNHIANIYTKIGVSNRAGASLYAMQHGLLPEETYLDD